MVQQEQRLKMNEAKLRVILLTHGGAEKVLEQLCALDSIEVAGVFVETANPPKRSLVEKLKRSVRYDGYLETCKKLFVSTREENHSSGAGSLDDMKRLATANNFPCHIVTDYHASDSISLIRSVDADLAVVFGTNILKETVFGSPKLGSINFHSGLVPHYRGGPPVFWELFNNESELGLTVHWMAKKVDTGDVIVQDRVPLSYDASYGLDFEKFISDYRSELAGKCASLVARAVDLIAKGAAPRIPQNPQEGHRYRLPVKKEKDELRRRLKLRSAQSQNGSSPKRNPE